MRSPPDFQVVRYAGDELVLKSSEGNHSFRGSPIGEDPEKRKFCRINQHYYFKILYCTSLEPRLKTWLGNVELVYALPLQASYAFTFTRVTGGI